MVYYELHSGQSAWRMDYRGLEGSRKSWRRAAAVAGAVETGTQDTPRAVREGPGPRDSLRPVRCRWQGFREGAEGHKMAGDAVWRLRAAAGLEAREERWDVLF